MGLRGPLPARSDADLMGHHRTKADVAAITKLAGAKRVTWFAADPEWHSEARQMYEGLKKSGQTHLFEPSDVAVAFFLAGQTSRFLLNGGTNGQMFSALMSAWNDLMATESSRRRLKVELQRDMDEAEKADPVALIMAQYAASTKKAPAANAA